MSNFGNRLIGSKIPWLMKKVAAIFDQIWLAPDEMRGQICELLGQENIGYQEVIVSGETTNLTMYTILEDKSVLVLSPKQDLRENILLNRWDSSWKQTRVKPIYSFVFNPDKDLLHLLQMPTMLLINLCVLENFPIPRLNLSIGTLASFLRKQQRAQVKIIDMQMGTTIDEIVLQAVAWQPDLIGISVNFGQKMTAFTLLDKLFQSKQSGDLQSIIIAGNVIPSFSPEQFLERYPDLLICDKEGEYTLRDLSEYLKGRLDLSKVNGICYRNHRTGKIQHNDVVTVDMNEVPTPALDTLKDIAKFRGALTLELSRGCDYSRCTFCPRDHKLKSWRPLSPCNALKQIDDLIRAGKTVGVKSHIFMADEEFIGELPDGREAERVIEICKGILSRPDRVRFDLAARADSVYEPKREPVWNVERLKMWDYCARVGVDRVFIGVESGCKRQLKRYGKGTTPEQNIVALRLLSALGINLRIGFIMFDQLMRGLDDIRENLDFLERTDAIMNPVNTEDISYEELYHRLLYDQDFIQQHQSGQSVYSIVSYMLASMEVLMNTPYARMVQLTERKEKISLILNEGDPDTNMGRYIIHFVDPVVGELSLASQMWIDSNFGVMYTVKSLYKVASPDEKRQLYDYMVRHRCISHYLLKYLIYCLEPSREYKKSLERYLAREQFERILPELPFVEGHLREQIQLAMTRWQGLMKRLIMDINNDLRFNVITDSADSRLEKAIHRWHDHMGEWKLINAPELQ